MDTKEFRRLGAKRIKAEQDEATYADQLRPMVVEALREGMRPAEVVEITGWSPAQVRTIARIGGVEPARRGRPAREVPE